MTKMRPPWLSFVPLGFPWRFVAIGFPISLMLVAVAAISRPFPGDAQVPPDPFRSALDPIDHAAIDS
jgi:hypothetical protein